MSHQQPLLMASEWSFPHHQRDHVSSAGVDPGPAIFPNEPTDRYGVNAATEHCSCALCTGSTSNGPPTWDTTNHQDWDSRSSGDAYINQGQSVSHPAGVPLTVPTVAQTQFATPGVQEQDNHAPSQATMSTSQLAAQTLSAVQPHQDPTVRISAAEVLRRLADRYVNNPTSLVSVVRLEPRPSGGFQVAIMLEMIDLL